MPANLNMKRKKINDKLIMPIILGVPFLFLVIRSIIEDRALSNDGFITNAVITRYKTSYRGYPIFEYEFHCNGKIYTGQITEPNLRSRAERDFIGRNFPVLYKSDDPTVSSPNI